MNSYIILAGRPEGKIPLDVGGRIILRWILERSDGVVTSFVSNFFSMTCLCAAVTLE
jgi:hypothetical protein